MPRIGLTIAVAVAVALCLLLVVVVSRVAQTGPALATLGGQVIGESDFQHYLATIHPPERVAEINRKRLDRASALEKYLDSRAIAEKARRTGLDRETAFKKALELADMKSLAHLMNERHRESILRNLQVTEEEVQEYYELHKLEHSVEPRFVAHMLLVYVKGNPAFPDRGLGDAPARMKAQRALAKLRAGNRWEEVARTYSDDASTNQKGGLIRDGQFGFAAPEVEHALKTQELGIPGEVIRTMFGYHVVQVDARTLERTPQPFEQVSDILRERLVQERSAKAREIFMTPIWQDVGFRRTEAGARDVPLMVENAVAPEEVLAEIAGRPVTESDFRWFLKDAFLPEQRMSVYSRPGARQGLLDSFLDMRVLETKARMDGLDKTPEFLRNRVVTAEQLLEEFVKERDQAGPAQQPAGSDEERQFLRRQYLDRVRAEVQLAVFVNHQ